MSTFYLKKPAEPVEYLGKEDSESYPMSYKKKRLCYIFNHENFKDSKLRSKKGDLEKRIGTDIDAHQLKNVFETLDFVVEEFKDFNYLEIMEKLQSVQTLDESESEYSCFVCCILSYGKKNYLCSCEDTYPVGNIYEHFLADKCKAFAGKPKIFFIQACPCDIDVSSTNSTDDGEQKKDVFRIPTTSDFLVVYSTIPGDISWNLKSDQGSWFIEALCTTIEKHISEMDLLQLLSIVNYKLSEMHKIKGLPVKVPCVTSTLTKDIKLIAYKVAEIQWNEGFLYDNHNKKGKVLIFNHALYKNDRRKPRPSTEQDKRKLEDLFNKLNFEEPCCFEQPTKETIFENLKKVAVMNHEEYSCFICCILTHGNLGKLSAYDQDYRIDDMLHCFFNKWNGKPKIFLIQACQGEKFDPGCNMVETTTPTEIPESDTDSEESVSEKIINFRYLSCPDFLLLSAAPPGYFSFRNPAGSWMVQELYEVFSHHFEDKDFLQIFTKANRQVTERVGQNSKKERAAINGKKITLCLTSTLTRNLDFRVFN